MWSTGFVCFCSFNNSSLWTPYQHQCKRLWLVHFLSACHRLITGPRSSLVDTCLGRGGKATRLCPGKMALEEQCSAPPRWRSISLTHIEFPEGTYTSFVFPKCRCAVSQQPCSKSRRACLRATEWTPPLVIPPNCETLREAGAQRGS